MGDPICGMCLTRRLESDRDRHLQMCSPCSEKLGVVPLPRPLRPHTPCRGCKGLTFVRAIPREVSNPSEAYQRVSPMAVTYGYHPATRAFISTATPLDSNLGLGTLEIYICKGCGLVDWFCLDPHNIPIGPQYMTEEIDYTSDAGPYR